MSANDNDQNKSRYSVDWETIEREYRAGVLSIREIGKIHGVSDTAIRKKAKEASPQWTRDLTEKVNAQVRTELVRSGVRNADPQTEREIVEAAAATVVQVVRSHRSRIKQGSELVELLTKQLMDVAGKREEFEKLIEEECSEDKTSERYNRLMKAVSLGTHAGIAVNLATATKTWVGLERQAFNIPDISEDPTNPVDLGQAVTDGVTAAMKALEDKVTGADIGNTAR